MTKKELLSPAGSIEAMYQAIHNGADAIYLAGKNFGARSYAPNFTNEELIFAIKYAHKYHVKVYVTVNILIHDSEISELLNYVKFIHENNVDAIIVEDIGIINLLHHTFPNLELHASTQMHNTGSGSCELVKKLGCKRIVLAREMSLEEINNLDQDLELEIFIHGALCISYSGECLFSSIILNRSGNRGSCAQACRMPYELYIDGKKQNKNKYVLSTKDLCTADSFTEIMQSKVKSLKIEGRMKSPEYVGLVTKIYRKLIDGYYENQQVDISSELEKLKYLFNRGFTKGNIFNENYIMNTLKPNHEGVEIGEVINLDNKIITLKLTKNLNLTDGIKFKNSDLGLTVYNLYKNNIQIKSAIKGEIVTIPNTIKLKEKDLVLKTSDFLLTKELAKYEEKKIPIDIKINAFLNKPLQLIGTVGTNTVELVGSLITKAEKNEITSNDIKEKISKIGGTEFTIRNLKIEKDDNIFVRFSEINELRRKLLNSFSSEIQGNIKVGKYIPKKIKEFKTLNFLVYVRNIVQLEAALKLKIKNFITNDKKIYEDYKYKINIYYYVELNDKTPYENEKLMVNNTNQFMKLKTQNNLILDYGFNIYNSYSINYFSDYLCTLSPEVMTSDINRLNKKYLNNVIFLAYGKIRLMTLKHCIISDSQKCIHCGKCEKSIILKDAFNNQFPIETNKELTFIYNCKNKNYIDEISSLKEFGISNYRIDLFNEDYNETISIISSFLMV